TGDGPRPHVRQLLGLEGQTTDLVVTDDVDQEPATQKQRELAQVDFRDHHPVVAPEHFAQVLRERVEVAQVCLGDPGTTAPYPAYPGGDGPGRAAPSS